MYHFSGMSIINKIYLLISSFVIMFVFAFALFGTGNYLDREKNIRAKQIFNVAEILERELNYSFTYILISKNTNRNHLKTRYLY